MGVADSIQQHETGRHPWRLQFVAADAIGRGEHIGDGPLLAQQSVDQARFAAFHLTDDCHGYARIWSTESASASVWSRSPACDLLRVLAANFSISSR